MCLSTNHSVTVCLHCQTAPRRGRSHYCGNACRQAAYRQGSAHAVNLALHRAARVARREHYNKEYLPEKRRAIALGPLGTYGGPTPAGIPTRAGQLNLKPFLEAARG